MSRRVHVGVALMVAVTGVAAPSPAQPLRTHVSCGDTVTTDTTLDSDLLNCRNNGIVIGADDITLNLNGHRVDGNDRSFAGCADGEFCDVGILNDGHDGVTVIHGTVRDFNLGVFVGRARHNLVSDVSSVSNRFVGIGIVESARSVVRNSSGNRNGGGDGDGMFLIVSHHVRVLHNTFRRNGELGIHVGDSNHNLIRGNLIARNARFALLMDGNRNRVRHNRIRRSDENIIVAPGNGNVITRNRISRSARGTSSSAIAIELGRRNLVAHNVIVDVQGPGIVLGLLHPSIGGGDNIVRGNVVRRSGGDAFTVQPKDDHSLLKRNIARGAKDDGFDINGRATTLTGNVAVRNGDLGIHASHRTIDGGGNVARNNGDPRQCVHISCLTSLST